MSFIPDSDKLWTAIERKNFAAVKSILDRSPELLHETYDGQRSFLYLAIETHSSVKIIQYLIELGADVNGGGTFTPLMVAAQTHNAKAVEILLHHGADPSRLLVLHPFVSESFSNIVKKLLDAGANPNLQDEEGRTALSWAIEDPTAEFRTIRLLVEYGANPNIPDDYGRTPFHSACLMGKAAVIELLLSAGANPNEPGEKNRTPLHYLLMHNNNDELEMVGLLLDAGANPTAVDAGGKSVLDYAKRIGNERVTALLERPYRIRERVQAARVAQERGLPADIGQTIGSFLGGSVRKRVTKRRKFNTTAASRVRRK